MILKNIKLSNYRNHSKLELDFDPAVNLISGPNGIGKTNILEAINLLATTKSFRAKYDRDLINHERDFTKVEATVETPDDNENLQLQIAKTERSERTSVKKVKVNNVARSLSKFSHFLKCVVFSPEDLDIITGSPSLRRRYLDSVLYQTDSKYKKTLNDYQKAVRSRNKLLEAINETGSGRDQLPFWNDKVLELGTYIQEKRTSFVAHVNNYLESRDNPYARYANKLKIVYTPNEVSTKRINEYAEREIITRTTLIGPHRDDFSIEQAGADMAQFASRGEQRTAVFLLKLAEFAFIKNQTDVKPILLLDDIFSELDAQHKEAILSFINDNQTIITSASAQELPEVYISKTIKLDK